MQSNNTNIRNMFVLKEKISEFHDYLRKNEILKNSDILRILPSGFYYIFTFKIDSPEQIEEIINIQDDWI